MVMVVVVSAMMMMVMVVSRSVRHPYRILNQLQLEISWFSCNMGAGP